MTMQDQPSPPAAGAAPSQPPVVPPSLRQWIAFVAVAVLLAVLDVGTKRWAQRTLAQPAAVAAPLCTPPPGWTHYRYQMEPTREIPLIRDYLDFQYTENCGAAFGLLHGASEKYRKPFFFLVSILAIGFIVQLFRQLEPERPLMRWALPFVLAGAIGNLYDRITLGYVVDFIHMHWKDHHYPTYNVADIAITIGIALMILDWIVGARPAPKQRPATSG